MRTQIVFSDKLNKGKYQALLEQARRVGIIRSEIWQRFGSINSVGLRDRKIRDKWMGEGRKFNVNATTWKIVLLYAMEDIKVSREAIKPNIKQAIYRHTSNQDERKRLHYLLRYNKWIDDKYLVRMMRKYYRRGHNHVINQILVRSDDYTVFTLGDKTWVKIPSLIKRKRIAIPLNTNIIPRGNLRIILRNDKVEIHYAVDIIKTNDCGEKTIGVDKGFTEVLVDSDGEHYGIELGGVLSKESDRLKIKYQSRNKLKHIAKKKPWVNKYNLGHKKLDRQSIKHKSIVKTIVHTAVNQMVNKAKIIATEDLTSSISGKKFTKDINRRLGAWTKGVIAKAIESVSYRRGSSVVYVNAAYTSQMDSQDGTLSGRRVGDTFYRENGDVLHADVNAARNVLARLYDTEINRWTPYKEVKSILLKRTECHRLKLLNQDSSCKPLGLSTESELSNEYIHV